MVEPATFSVLSAPCCDDCCPGGGGRTCFGMRAAQAAASSAVASGFAGGAGFGAANFVDASGAFCSVAAGFTAGAAGAAGSAGTAFACFSSAARRSAAAAYLVLVITRVDADLRSTDVDSETILTLASPPMREPGPDNEPTMPTKN